jgi:hypothetical protein
MKRHLTRKTLVTLGAVCVFFLLPAAAFPWNQATHAHIADALAARVGQDNLQEMWGSVAPDFFNYIFDPAVCPGWVSDQTHGVEADTFLKVWNAAGAKKEEALAYGFVSHNGVWGADYSAHEASLTLGSEEGYVIAKARLLLNAPLDPASPHPTFGEVFADSFGVNPDVALLIAHVITEYAVDIRLGSEVDPSLGRKLAAAARGETKRFADLLVEAFAADYAAYCFSGDTARAASVLTAAEKAHREDMIYLGQAISQSEPVAVRRLAEQLVVLLPDFLGAPLPANTQEVMEAGISTAMALCDDYLPEIEATIEFVAKNLKEQGIVYEYRGKPGH